MKKDYSKAILLFAAVMFIAFTFKMGQSFKQGVSINEVRKEIAQGISETIETDENGETIEKSETYYTFRTNYLKEEHFEKHGIDMGFATSDDYEKAANEVINSDEALLKTEEEDGDQVYYIIDTNEIVFLSTDGYIRTYFNPDDGKAYFDRQ